jgi:hypothetical protein
MHEEEEEDGEELPKSLCLFYWRKQFNGELLALLITF